jgi:hypothetical protein
MAGKMAAQKRFVSADRVFAAPEFAGLESGQAIDEAELRAVRQVSEGIGEIVHVTKAAEGCRTPRRCRAIRPAVEISPSS